MRSGWPGCQRRGFSLGLWPQWLWQVPLAVHCKAPRCTKQPCFSFCCSCCTCTRVTAIHIRSFTVTTRRRCLIWMLRLVWNLDMPCFGGGALSDLSCLTPTLVYKTTFFFPEWSRLSLFKAFSCYAAVSEERRGAPVCFCFLQNMNKQICLFSYFTMCFPSHFELVVFRYPWTRSTVVLWFLLLNQTLLCRKTLINQQMFWAWTAVDLQLVSEVFGQWQFRIFAFIHHYDEVWRRINVIKWRLSPLRRFWKTSHLPILASICIKWHECKYKHVLFCQRWSWTDPDSVPCKGFSCLWVLLPSALSSGNKKHALGWVAAGLAVEEFSVWGHHPSVHWSLAVSVLCDLCDLSLNPR